MPPGPRGLLADNGFLLPRNHGRTTEAAQCTRALRPQGRTPAPRRSLRGPWRKLRTLHLRRNDSFTCRLHGQGQSFRHCRPGKHPSRPRGDFQPQHALRCLHKRRVQGLPRPLPHKGVAQVARRTPRLTEAKRPGKAASPESGDEAHALRPEAQSRRRGRNLRRGAKSPDNPRGNLIPGIQWQLDHRSQAMRQNRKQDRPRGKCGNHPGPGLRNHRHQQRKMLVPARTRLQGPGKTMPARKGFPAYVVRL